MNVRKMSTKKRAVLQAVNEVNGWFMSNDLVPRVEELLERKTTHNTVGSYLFQLFEDGYLNRERITNKYGSYRYRYHRRET